MSKVVQLPTYLSEQDADEVRKAAEDAGMTTAEFVRHVLSKHVPTVSGKVETRGGDRRSNKSRTRASA